MRIAVKMGSREPEDVAQSVLLSSLCNGRGLDLARVESKAGYWYMSVRNRVMSDKRRNQFFPLDEAWDLRTTDDLLIEQRERLRELAAEAGPVKTAKLVAYAAQRTPHTDSERVQHFRVLHGAQPPRAHIPVPPPERHCLECGVVIGRSKRLCPKHREERQLARARAYIHGHYIPVEPPGCCGCGVDIEERSEGCRSCYHRHAQREYRIRSGDGSPRSSGN